MWREAIILFVSLLFFEAELGAIIITVLEWPYHWWTVHKTKKGVIRQEEYARQYTIQTCSSVYYVILLKQNMTKLYFFSYER